MNKIELRDKTLIVNEDGVKQFDLDALRLIFLIFPGSFSWYVVASSQKINSLNVDMLNSEQLSMLSAELYLMMQSSSGLSSYKLYMANYTGQTAVVTLSELKKYDVDLFAGLLNYREKRLAKRKEWVKTCPTLELKGKFGSRMTLSADGVHMGRKFLAWEDVATYQIEEGQFGVNGHFLIIPKGVYAGLFSFTKYKYKLNFIRLKKAPLYMAECEFWRNLKESEGSNDLVSQLKKLQKLKDDGTLTQERFEEAKKKLLEVGS